MQYAHDAAGTPTPAAADRRRAPWACTPSTPPLLFCSASAGMLSALFLPLSVIVLGPPASHYAHYDTARLSLIHI